MNYDPDARDREGLISFRQSQGWTVVSSSNWEEWFDNPEPREWLTERLGPGVDLNDWSGQEGAWDFIGTNALISDPKVALLFKLTWGGK
jgi:hypothetical protein